MSRKRVAARAEERPAGSAGRVGTCLSVRLTGRAQDAGGTEQRGRQGAQGPAQQLEEEPRGPGPRLSVTARSQVTVPQTRGEAATAPASGVSACGRSGRAGSFGAASRSPGRPSLLLAVRMRPGREDTRRKTAVPAPPMRSRALTGPQATSTAEAAQKRRLDGENPALRCVGAAHCCSCTCAPSPGRPLWGTQDGSSRTIVPGARGRASTHPHPSGTPASPPPAISTVSDVTASARRPRGPRFGALPCTQVPEVR